MYNLNDLVDEVKKYGRYYQSADIFNCLPYISIHITDGAENSATIRYGGNDNICVGSMEETVSSLNDVPTLAFEISEKAARLLKHSYNKSKKRKPL